MNGIREYLLSVSSTALIVGVTSMLVPQGAAKKTVELIGAMLLVLAVIMPFAKISPAAMARTIAQFQMDAEEMQTGIEVKNQDILADLIKQKCEAYILDKAEKIGVTIDADITISKEGGYPYPVQVQISGRLSKEDRAYLQTMIERDIGIAVEQQEWK